MRNQDNGVNPEKLTLRELLKLTNAEEAPLPTVQQIQTSGIEALCTVKVNETLLTVYRNGYFTYTNGLYTTVQSVNRCREGLVYRFQDDTVTTLGYEVFADEPFAIRLALEGERRLAHNQAVRVKQHTYSYDNMPEESSNLGFEDDFAKAYAEREETNAFLQSIRKAIPQLTERQKKVIWLYFFEGWKQEQIAGELGCTKQAISGCIQGALRKIRKRSDLPLKRAD